MGREESKVMLFWTTEEYKRFSEAIIDKPMSYYAFEMLYWTGMRLGECLALTMADFDFNKNTVRICKSYQRLEGKDVITTPKTKKSNRTIKLPKFLAEEMKVYFEMLYGYKETDRISCMYKELSAMGADIEELEDGLLIRKSTLKANPELHGYADHRIVMALSVAGLCCDGETVVDTSEAAAVTFPNFQDLIRQCGGIIENVE